MRGKKVRVVMMMVLVCYDEINSSKTINEVIKDVIDCTPADHLADIYTDGDSGQLSESDTEDRGPGLIWICILDMNSQLTMLQMGGWNWIVNKLVFSTHRVVRRS